MTLFERARTALDHTIAAISPSWGAERSAWRATLRQVQRAERLSSFRTASQRRTEREASAWRTADGDLESDRARWKMVLRGRQLERNSALAFGCLRASVDNVIGTGFHVDPGTDDDAWNEQARTLWTTWCANDCDVRGLSTFDELLASWCWSYLRDGDVGIVLTEDGKLQSIEADLITTPMKLQVEKRGAVVDGVELDRRGRPTTYYVLDETVGTVTPSTTYTAVPADQMIFVARRQRLGQTRGLPAFAQVAWLFDQIDGYLEATTVAARMAACFALVFERKTKMGTGDTGVGTDGVPRRKLRAEPGSAIEIDPGEKVTSLQGAQPTGDIGGFLAVLVRFCALVLGLPLEVALLDFSRTNYSSARAALLQAWQVWACLQAVWKRVCTRIYLWKIAQWMDEGLLAPRDDADLHEWRAPGWRWLDSEKEIKAALAAIDGNLQTHADTVAGLGGNAKKVIKQRAKEVKEMKDLDLPQARSTLTRDPGGAPASPGTQPNEPPAAGDGNPEDAPPAQE
jgi:lambda family phage portal protein